MSGTKKPESRLKAEGELLGRQQAYIATFPKDSPTVQAVLRDLASFCRAHNSTFAIDPRLHALQEGRREVWLRITEHLELDGKALWELYTKTKF